MGPPEVLIGWGVFLGLALLSASLGISGRLAFGEALTAGLLSIPAGLGAGGWIHATRNAQTGPFRYAIPCIVVAVIGYIVLFAGVDRARARFPREDRPRSIVVGYAVVVVTAAFTTIATVASGEIAGYGAPTWVAPSLTGITTFAGGSFLVARLRRSERIARGARPVRPAVRSETAIAATIGAFVAACFASLSIPVMIGLVVLPIAFPFMWSAAGKATIGGRAAISFFVALDLSPLGAFLAYALGASGGIVAASGAVLGVIMGIVFAITAVSRTKITSSIAR